MEFPHPGQTFQGKYKLLEVLGRGGFAAVYKASDIEIGREVAIKLLTPGEDGYDSSIVARFQREARIIAQLKDPHTITMFDYGKTADGLLYMVFEYVAGTDLSVRLNQTGPLPAEIVMHVLDQLLHALREAHEAGVLHRDIKPANVLVFPYLDDDWQVKLLDFGIAKPGIGQNADPVATLTRAGGIIGTPRYMSPEQLCGEELTPATDLYSLGLVAYEMLVGAPAIAGRDTRDNIVLQLSTEPLLLPPTAPVPQPLRRVVERMMARDTEDRFQSAREVINALRGPDASGPQTGPYGSIPTPKRLGPPQPHPGPAHGLFPTPQSHGPGLAASSSGEVAGYRPPTTGFPQIDEAKRLPPLALLGLGIALGIAIVIPIMLMLQKDETPPPDTPRIANALTKPPVDSTTDPAAPDEEETVPETTPPVDRDPCSGKPEQTGFVTETADFGLGGRGVVTYVPETYEQGRKYPVVVVFHDRTRNPKQAIADMKLADLADSEGFIVLAPGGREYNAPWNPHTDIDFVNELLTKLSSTYCVDERHRFGVAHNVGAQALEMFACLIPFSAIATTAYRGTEQLACEYSPPVPHIHLVGKRDRYHPIQGGSTCDLRTAIPLQAKEKVWAEHNGCRGKRQTYLEVDAGVCETFETCEAPFVACITDGGRDWPGSASRDIQLPGCIEKPSEFPVSQTVWSFFAKHGQPIEPKD